MVGKALQGIRKGLTSISDFLIALSGTPKRSATPDPAKAAAKRVQGAMSVGFKGAGGTTATDKFLGKELAAGHKKARKHS